MKDKTFQYDVVLDGCYFTALSKLATKFIKVLFLLSIPIWNLLLSVCFFGGSSETEWS